MQSFSVEAVSPAGAAICRAFFERLPTSDRLWLYGDLHTDPDHRRRGLALQVLEEGVRVARRWQSEKIYCFIGKQNLASAAAHRRFGFLPTGYSRTVVRVDSGVLDRVIDSDTVVELNNKRIPVLLAKMESRRLADLRSRTDLMFLTDRLQSMRSWLPWRSSREQTNICSLNTGGTAIFRWRTGGVTAFWHPGCPSLSGKSKNSLAELPIKRSAELKIAVFHSTDLRDCMSSQIVETFEVWALDL